MRKIIVDAMVSMDGIMQAPGGPTEDPTKGFKFGGWVTPYFDQEFGEEIDHILKNFDLLLGRKTYEIFAAYWPYYDEGGSDGDIARRFNEIKKYAKNSSRTTRRRIPSGCRVRAFRPPASLSAITSATERSRLATPRVRPQAMPNAPGKCA